MSDSIVIVSAARVSEFPKRILRFDADNYGGRGLTMVY